MENRKPINCILLVDDDHVNNFINLKLLQKIQASDSVQTALNGQEALEFIHEYCSVENKCCPELIFLDINMPVMNGFEFLELYQGLDFENKSKVRIVVLTTSTNPDDLRRIRELGISDFVNKPLTEDKVLKFLNT